MAVGTGSDHILALLQHIGLVDQIVVGSHILNGEGHGQGLGSAGLQSLGLAELDQIGGCLFNAALGVGRIEVDAHDILAGHIAGVGDGDFHGQIAVLFLQLAHLVGEGGVAQAVAEGILDDLVIVKAFHADVVGGLVELVAHVDTVHIVDEGGGVGLGTTGVHAVNGHIQQIGVVDLGSVVPPGCLGHVIQEGVGSVAGGVDLAAEDLAQSVEAHVAGAGAPDCGLDLLIFFHEAHFDGVCAVVQNDDLVEVLAHQLDHVLFGLGQLQIVLTGFEIQIFVGVVVESNLAYVHGQVIVTLACGTGQNNHSHVGEGLGVADQLLGIGGNRGLGQSPALLLDGHFGTFAGVGGVEGFQLFVQGEACVDQALLHGNDVEQGVDAAGTGTAVQGIHGCPAEQVQVHSVGQGQCIFLVLQQNEAFSCHGLSHQLGLFGGVCVHLGFAHGQADQVGHGSKADQVCGNCDGQHHSKDRIPADNELLALAHVLDERHSDDDCDANHQSNGQRDQVLLAGLQYADHVLHVDL